VVGGNRLSPAKAFTLVAILTAILVEWVVATTGKGAYFELARPDFAVGIFILAVAAKFIKDIQ
jgi:hypothetical protein